MKNLFFLICVLFSNCNMLHAFSWPWEEVNQSTVTTEHLKDFGQQLGDKYKLKYLNNGVGTVVDSKNVAYDLSFMCNHCVTIDQSRKLAKNIMNDFWRFASTDKEIYKDMQVYCKILKNYDPILTPNRLGMKLSFWDKNMNRLPAPYISQVIVSDGFIYFYTADPKDQSLQNPAVENL